MSLSESYSLEHCREFLPKIALEIAELIGFEKLELLIKHFGGISVQKWNFAQLLPTLAATIGQACAEKLAARFDGVDFYLPRCDKALRHQRNLSLIRDFDQLQAQGISKKQAMIELCPRYGLNNRTAWDILRNAQNAR